MALSTKWVDFKPTNPVTAAWLNDVDDLVYTIFGGGTPTGGNTASQLLWITGSDTISMGSAATAASTALFELNSTTKGFLPPRMTTAQRTAISTPAEGLVVYDTDLSLPCVYNGSGWDLMDTPWTLTGSAISYTAGQVTIADLVVTTDATFAGATIADLGTVTTADINGGTIDGATVGASSPTTGRFTTVGAGVAATYTLDVDVGAPGGVDKTIARFSSGSGLRDVGILWDDSLSTLGVGTLTAHNFAIHTGGNSNPRVTVSASGPFVGIGATPKTWETTYVALQVEGVAVASPSPDSAEFTSNAYFDNTDNRWEYITTNPAARYNHSAGLHQWHTAASGTADTAITWTEQMRLNSNSQLIVNATSSSAQLHVTGNGRRAFQATADANQWATWAAGDSTSGQSYGSLIRAGTNTSDTAFQVDDQTGGTTYFHVRGDGKAHFGGYQPQGTVHIETSSAGAISPHADADDLIIENSGNAGISIFSGTTGYASVFMGDSGASAQGYFQYDQTNNQTNIGAGGATRVTIGTGVQVGSPTGGDQGAGTINATGLYIDGVAVSTGGGFSSGSGFNQLTTTTDNTSIGHTSDNGYKLQVHEDTAATDVTLQLSSAAQGSTSSSGGLIRHLATGGHLRLLNQTTSGELQFYLDDEAGTNDQCGKFKHHTSTGVQFLVGNSGFSGFAIATEFEQPIAGGWVNAMYQTSASGNIYGQIIDFTNQTPDDNTSYFLRCEDSTAIRAYIWSDGDLANHDGTYGTISDARYKTVLNDARDYIEDWKKLRYVNYEMHTGPGKKLFGLVAQEVEQVFPGCVSNAMIVDKENKGQKKEQKFIKSSILHEIQGKVIQELIAKVEALEAKVGA